MFLSCHVAARRNCCTLLVAHLERKSCGMVCFPEKVPRTCRRFKTRLSCVSVLCLLLEGKPRKVGKAFESWESHREITPQEQLGLGDGRNCRPKPWTQVTAYFGILGASPRTQVGTLERARALPPPFRLRRKTYGKNLGISKRANVSLGQSRLHPENRVFFSFSTLLVVK